MQEKNQNFETMLKNWRLMVIAHNRYQAILAQTRFDEKYDYNQEFSDEESQFNTHRVH